jgi:hypothetical protein
VPLDLTGISNVNEFYSHHYLDALLESDIKSLVSRWEEVEEEQGLAAPHKKLSGCAQEYFKGKAQTSQTASIWDHFDETHRINVLLAEALGYGHEVGAYEFVEDEQVVPVLASLQRDGQPYLWIVEAQFPGADHPPVLDQVIDAFRKPEAAEDHALPKEKWENLLSQVFRREQPPRWLLLLAGSEIYLIERHKWGQGKYLLFDVDEILGRRQNDTLKAMAALLARDALCPDDGTVLHDALDESSHKHAFAVSEDLKFGIRRAVELLGNEYVHYQRTVARGALYQDDEMASKLTSECLTYLYRLLFLFYAEARGGEIGVVPMRSDEYRLGYSLESLRDLEQVALTTFEAQSGYFIDSSLKQLFLMINEGYQPNEEQLLLGLKAQSQTIGLSFDDEASVESDKEEAFLDHGFSIQGLDSPLFDTKRTPLLSSVRFRNAVLQEVIQLLSLSKEKNRRERGRISYAQLGINQLGAVYEGLLSYSGFFAQETLYEVKQAGAAARDETKQSYFVPESDIAKYEEDEFVYEEDDEGGRLRRRYERGSFIFRLAGRDREKSASYYTPEVLTECVVKYSLKELLKDKTADEILHLTVCEPAMGSGAFLNEAVNQLADAYLERKQDELGESISPSNYIDELQKVKAHMAIHNCYGVDLNPTAVELAKVSLWLNTIYEGARCPWFDLRLAVGNSLIGARRQVFNVEDLMRRNSKANPNWLGLVPDKVAVGPEWETRPKDSVYHFLVPDEGMAAFDKDKVIRELAKENTEQIKKWRKDFCQPFEKSEAHKLVELSDAVDALWQQVIRERQGAVAKTRQAIDVWGQKEKKEEIHTFADHEGVAAEVERPYTAYRRLKLVMDYWCALWFWPIQDAAKLPSRDTFLMDVELILKGTVTAKVDESLQLGLFGGEPVSEEHKAFIQHHGLVNVDELCEKVERLKVAHEVAQRVRFQHWELRFAELFAERGGFDLIVGNPPWVLLSFDEAGVLSDSNPLIAVRKLSAKQVTGLRKEEVQNEFVSDSYLSEYVVQNGTQNFLGSYATYPLLKGMKSNLYKCFITRSWEIGSGRGFIGLLHPEGIYDDPRGGELRAAVYPRLKGHFQFINELSLFPEVHHLVKYSVNIYSSAAQSGSVSGSHMSNLFHPSTIGQSIKHDGHGAVPGIKDEENHWNLRPHRNRLIHIGKSRLETLARLYDTPGTLPLQARLPVVHSEEVVSVLEKFAEQPRRLSNLEGDYFATTHWNETNAQQNGTIKRETVYPKDPSELVLSGPHFFQGTLLNKTPNEGCRNNLDYSRVDLSAIDNSYLPRTNYMPSCDIEEYIRRTPKWDNVPVTNYYRHVHREMVSPTGERTLVAAICPKNVGHLYTVIGICFKNIEDLLIYNAMATSLPVDFFIKTTGVGHINVGMSNLLPLPIISSHLKKNLINRILSLNCLTSHFDELLEESGKFFDFYKKDLSVSRTDIERRQNLVELDVLSSMILDLSEEELITIYHVQFPVLQQNERANRYDQTGRLVPREVLKIADRLNIDTNAPFNLSGFKGDTAFVGEVDTPALGVIGGIRWEDPKMEPRMERVYPPPFTKCDREADMRQAYRVFQERIKESERVTV